MAKGTIVANPNPIRCVNSFSCQNRAKDKDLDLIFYYYGIAYKITMSYLYNEFYLNSRKLSSKPKPDKELTHKIYPDEILNIVPARMILLIYQQAYGAFKSYIKLNEFYYKEYLFKFKRDYKRDPNKQELSSILRQIRNNLAYKPSVKLKHIMADSHMIKIEEAKSSTEFNRWIRIMNLKGKKAIYIPYRGSKYKDYNLRGSINIVKRENSYNILLNQNVDKIEYVAKRDVIGIDFGLKDFMATNDKILGNRFISWLFKQDELLSKTQASLQSKGVKPRTAKRYNKLVYRIKEYTKNEICRLFNLILKEAPKVIRLESLEFRYQGLSKRLNRLLAKFANKIIKEKLQRLTDIYGIIVEYVNPAYTSKECCDCGYISATNRVDTKIFCCRYCGNKLNANINASRNIARRSSDSLKHSIKRVLIDRLSLFMRDNEIMRLSENKFLISSKSRANIQVVVRNKYLKLLEIKPVNA